MVDIKTISENLVLDDSGIWSSSDGQDISYPSDGNESCFTVEDSSFWFKHRNSCIVSVVNSYPPSDGGAIFDVGGGNGFVTMALVKAGHDAVLVEPGCVGAANGKKRGLKHVICATTDTAKFKFNSLPAVGLFDVVEHIEHDLEFLQSIRSLVRKDGYVYLTVPAYSYLWSDEDVKAGHFRRYSLNEISTLADTAGFKVEFASYIFRFLPIPIFLLRSLPYKFGLATDAKGDNKNISRDHAANGGVVSKVLDAILHSEVNNLNHKKPMRFGGSCLLVARNSR